MALRHYGSGIYGWSRYQPDRGYEFNGTAALAGEGVVLLIDPVPASTEELTAIRALGQRFEIVLLNADHERDSAQFARFFEAPVSVAAPDASALRSPPTQTFGDGDQLSGGWTVHTLKSMKTPGESILYHPELRTVVAGDAVIADPLTGLRLVPPAKLPDRAGALGALAQVAALDFDALFPGDGFVLPAGGREALRRFLSKEGLAPGTWAR
jgi:glyoxylase-like metal-dependent hydrolase (beta-lactamase superfamily II)